MLLNFITNVLPVVLPKILKIVFTIIMFVTLYACTTGTFSINYYSLIKNKYIKWINAGVFHAIGILFSGFIAINAFWLGKLNDFKNASDGLIMFMFNILGSAFLVLVLSAIVYVVCNVISEALGAIFTQR